MREIKFRGKRVFDGNWVYGYYFGGFNWADFIEDARFEHRVQVIPESVGQYTGLKDRNGKDIYEGDNVFYDGIQGVVYFEDCSFFVRFEYTRSVHLLGELERDLEIIGNIHEQQGGSN